MKTGVCEAAWFLVLLVCAAEGLSQSKTSPWLLAQRQELATATQSGSRLYTLTFSPRRLFGGAPGFEAMNEAHVVEARTLIREATASGLSVIGTSPVWVFPDLVDAPSSPLSGAGDVVGPSEVRLQCIPDLQSAGYRELVEQRNVIFSLLAEAFPEITIWIVGFEPNFVFVDCRGEELSVNDFVVFAADSLSALKGAIQSSSPGATVVGHFLGRTGLPYSIRGREVPPGELANRILREIGGRGEPLEAFFDAFITLLEPTLLSERGVQGQSEAAWQVKFLEEFRTPSLDMSRDEANYPHWNPVRTGRRPPPIRVSIEQSALVQIGPTRKDAVSAGAKTNEFVDVVPDEEFNLEGRDRKTWSVVLDWRPGREVQPGTAHAPVFLRVQDRVWRGSPDQTRIGAFVFGGRVTQLPCRNQACAALQFTGDDARDSTVGRQFLIPFPLSRRPYRSLGRQYRIQVFEREMFRHVDGTYQPQWRAEIVDITKTPFSNRLGATGWIWRWTVENVYGIVAPTLEGSNIMFGLGPGKEGEMIVERVGTAFVGALR